MLWPHAKVYFTRVEREGKRGRGLTVGWCGGECYGMFLQQLSIPAHTPVLSGEGTVTCVSMPV